MMWGATDSVNNLDDSWPLLPRDSLLNARHKDWKLFLLLRMCLSMRRGRMLGAEIRHCPLKVLQKLGDALRIAAALMIHKGAF